MTSSLIAETKQKFEDDAGAARSAPRVTATLTNGRARLSAGAFNWESDLPVGLGGGNLAPSPTAYLLGALAGCAVAFLHDTLAPLLGIQLNGVTATASCDTDARGLLGMQGAVPDLRHIELDVSVTSDEPDERLDELYRAWLERCPIYLAITGQNPVVTRFARRATS